MAALGILILLAVGSTSGGPAGSAGDRPQAGSAPTAPSTSSSTAPTSSSTVATSPAATPTESTRPDEPEGDLVTFGGTPEPPPSQLARFYGQRLAWKRCAAGPDQCAMVSVPLNHDAPNGATAAIAMRKVPASSPTKRRGTLFINPGGPGESGIDFAAEAGQVFGSDVLEVWDVVGFDPRGVGASGGFECLTDRDLDAWYAADPTPESAAETAALRKATVDRNTGCLRRGGALAANMGSEAVARDLDIMRAAVGDERLNFYGASYGTLIGATYADLFTSRVGLITLDSATTPDGGDLSVPEQSTVDAYARGASYDFDDVFDDFASECVAAGSCALGATTKAASATLVTFIDSLEKAPLPTDYDSLPRLTQGWAVTAIGFGLREPEAWSDLVDAVDAAITDRDGSELASLAMFGADREDDGAYFSPSFAKNGLPVDCADWPVTPWDLMQPSPDVLENHPLWARVAVPAVPDCSGWTGRVRTDLTADSKPDTPILVIGNVDDPVTPIEDTEYQAELIQGSRFVTVDAQGHGAYGAGNRCADDVVENYLVRGIAPTDEFRCPG